MLQARTVIVGALGHASSLGRTDGRDGMDTCTEGSESAHGLCPKEPT